MFHSAYRVRSPHCTLLFPQAERGDIRAKEKTKDRLGEEATKHFYIMLSDEAIQMLESKEWPLPRRAIDMAKYLKESVRKVAGKVRKNGQRQEAIAERKSSRVCPLPMHDRAFTRSHRRL